jgi:hypothetical protein
MTRQLRILPIKEKEYLIDSSHLRRFYLILF